MTQQDWRVSSYTGQQGNCVEVFRSLGGARDSKHRKGGVVRITPGFLTAVKTGGFDPPQNG